MRGWLIWADRAGLGLWAIALVLIATAMFAGLFGPLTLVNANQAAPKSAFVLPSDKDGGLTFDEAFGIEPPKTAVRISAETAGKMTAFVALPIWIVLRVVDFIFGGPMRRKRNLQARRELRA